MDAATATAFIERGVVFRLIGVVHAETRWPAVEGIALAKIHGDQGWIT